MALEFTVHLENKPGRLAQIGKLLGDAGVKIDALHGYSKSATDSIVQFVCDDEETARAVLDKSNMDFTTEEVLMLSLLDEPGGLHDIALVMMKAGINIDRIYLTTDGIAVMGVDDLAGAMEVAQGMAVMRDQPPLKRS